MSGYGGLLCTFLVFWVCADHFANGLLRANPLSVDHENSNNLGRNTTSADEETSLPVQPVPQAVAFRAAVGGPPMLVYYRQEHTASSTLSPSNKTASSELVAPPKAQHQQESHLEVKSPTSVASNTLLQLVEKHLPASSDISTARRTYRSAA